MTTLFTRARIGVAAAALLAFAIPTLTPQPAEAWGYRGGPGWHGGWGPGWHGGWHAGWRPGYFGGWRGGYGYHGCCYGAAIVGLPGPVLIAPPVYAYAPHPWIRAHWNGPYWVPAHWG